MVEIISYKNRIIDLNKSVEIYRNLTKRKYWLSIKQSGLVVGHAQVLFLKDCTFKCNQRIKEYSKRINKKLVHTTIQGYIIDEKPYTTISLIYNDKSITGFSTHCLDGYLTDIYLANFCVYYNGMLSIDKIESELITIYKLDYKYNIKALNIIKNPFIC